MKVVQRDQYLVAACGLYSVFSEQLTSVVFYLQRVQRAAELLQLHGFTVPLNQSPTSAPLTLCVTSTPLKHCRTSAPLQSFPTSAQRQPFPTSAPPKQFPVPTPVALFSTSAPLQRFTTSTTLERFPTSAPIGTVPGGYIVTMTDARVQHARDELRPKRKRRCPIKKAKQQAPNTSTKYDFVKLTELNIIYVYVSVFKIM